MKIIMIQIRGRQARRHLLRRGRGPPQRRDRRAANVFCSTEFHRVWLFLSLSLALEREREREREKEREREREIDRHTY